MIVIIPRKGGGMKFITYDYWIGCVVEVGMGIIYMLLTLYFETKKYNVNKSSSKIIDKSKYTPTDDNSVLEEKARVNDVNTCTDTIKI